MKRHLAPAGLIVTCALAPVRVQHAPMSDQVNPADDPTQQGRDPGSRRASDGLARMRPRALGSLGWWVMTGAALAAAPGGSASAPARGESLTASAISAPGVSASSARASSAGTVAPQRDWQSLRSPHFHVIGNAGQRNLRQVAERLEQFRETFGLLFPRTVRAASRPITVVVFRNHKSFEPFKPLREGKALAHVAGFFQGGRGVDYIALTTEGGFDYGIIYHEYVHVLANAVGVVPVWFGEGLAEYYRSFEVAGRRHAMLGRVLEGHVWLLREQWLPLITLLAVDHNSPHYNETNKASVFYAESWALVHYLLLGESQKYTKRVAPFLQQLAQGASAEAACANALGVPLGVLERDLRRYVEQSIFPRQAVTLTERISSLERLPVAPVAEAEAHATLGDLLLQMRRPEAARLQLGAALALDEGHAAAHASMGRLLLDAGLRDEARAHLEKAVAGAGANWLTHYTYGSVLNETRGSGAGDGIDGPIERALRRAIELNPDFADSYAQLAWLKMGQPATPREEIDALIREALDRAPGEGRYVYLQASALVQRGKGAEARPLLQRLTGSADQWLRGVAADALARIDAADRPRATGAFGDQASRPAADPIPAGSRFLPVLRTPAEGEQRVSGLLTAIDCGPPGVSLALRVKGQQARARVPRLEDVEFITYRSELEGRVECGARGGSEAVIVTYRPSQGDEGVLGDAVAVEFLPEDYEAPE